MLAFHNNPAIKETYLQRIREHRAQDDLIRGTYWQHGRGCAVGCTIEKQYNVHKEFEIQLGIPRSIAYLEDTLFEGMSWMKALDFPERFLQSIKVGSDLSSVPDRFVLCLLSDEKYGLYDIASHSARDAISSLVALVNKKLTGEIVTVSEWENIFVCDQLSYTLNLSEAAKHVNQALLRLAAFYIDNGSDLLDVVMYASTGHARANSLSPDTLPFLTHPMYADYDTYSKTLNNWMNYMADRLIELLEAAPIPILSGEENVNMLTSTETLEELSDAPISLRGDGDESMSNDFAEVRNKDVQG